MNRISRRSAFQIPAILISVCALVLSLLIVELYFRYVDNARQINGNNNVDLVADADMDASLRKAASDQEVRPETFNIYYFGGSVMRGEPFHDSIPQLVSAMLSGSVGGKDVRWVNVADFSRDLAYASRRAQWIASHRDIYHPSLFVFYTGNNEFLKYHDEWGFSAQHVYGNVVDFFVTQSRAMRFIAEKLRLYRLEIDDRQEFDRPLLPEDKKQEVHARFGQDLQALADYATGQGVPLIVGIESANEADFDPNRSVYCADETRRSEFVSFMENGENAQDSEDWASARDWYEKAREICNQFSRVHFRLGNVYEHLGLMTLARDAYQQALNTDGFPIRTTSEETSAASALGTHARVTVIDTTASLRASTPRGVIGNELMLDGHHPNARGYRIIARDIARAIVQYFNTNDFIRSLSDVEAESILMPSVHDRYEVYLSRAKWYMRLATWTYDPTLRLAMATEYADAASRMEQDTAQEFLVRAVIAYLQRNAEKGETFITRARMKDPAATNKFIAEPWFIQIVSRARQ